MAPVTTVFVQLPIDVLAKYAVFVYGASPRKYTTLFTKTISLVGLYFQRAILVMHQSVIARKTGLLIKIIQSGATETLRSSLKNSVTITNF